MSTIQRLYLVVREDLSPGQQATQAAHALRQFVAEHPAQDKHWFETSNTLVLVAAKNEEHLNKLDRKLRMNGVAVSRFTEPDLAGSLTAIAVSPDGSRILRNLKLALKS